MVNTPLGNNTPATGRHPLNGTRRLGSPVRNHGTPDRFAQADGLFQVTVAPFRGSCNDVLSQAIRVAGQGSRVMIAQFLSGGINQGPEQATRLCGSLEWIRPAIDCCLVDPAAITPQHHRAVNAVWAASHRQLLAGGLDLMVLDEVGLALEFGLLEEDHVLKALRQRPASLDLTLIGSAMSEAILDMANQVTRLRCRHSSGGSLHRPDPTSYVPLSMR
ncbi:MAG: ATP--corrinoid adenosyltransferase [Synechococcus sp. SB0665_bin_28]|nr:ATP--corrinoid adenosyltransferase [Synechococcus sp. SB0665_bin_28]MYF20339.1 ATP--corrinoid adenosyltransferase [Synechococcus sp. SB0677_bin_5]